MKQTIIYVWQAEMTPKYIKKTIIIITSLNYKYKIIVIIYSKIVHLKLINEQLSYPAGAGVDTKFRDNST